MLECCFYSKLVRLKRLSYYLCNENEIAFLFQTGAIKTQYGVSGVKLSAVFLFQTGAIKTSKVLAFLLFVSSFYSKLVRLKLCGCLLSFS